MQEQKEFAFVAEETKQDFVTKAKRLFGAEVQQPGEDFIREVVREEIREVVHDAVDEAIRRQRSQDGHDFITCGLKELIEETLDEYFKPIRDDFNQIADSYRQDIDDADWWKRGGYDDDDE